jgi:hypothetical protein
MFQVTMSQSHPVKAKGLKAVLTQLGIEPAAFAEKVALVFVVPSAKAISFKRQRIDGTTPLSNRTPITIVNGIKRRIPAALEGTNIRSVGHLRQLPSTAKLQTAEQKRAHSAAQQLLQRHEQEAVPRECSIHHALERVPQFVLGVPESSFDAIMSAKG